MTVQEVPTGSAPVDDEVVRGIVDQVWESLLQAPALEWTGPADALPAQAEVLTAEISLTGDWSGRVRLVCDPVTAHALAAAMLGTDADEPLPVEDVVDAVGEVVNVVGGNVKGTLLGTTALGLPRVTADDRWGTTGSTGRRTDRSTAHVVEWAGRPVLVEVVPDPPG